MSAKTSLAPTSSVDRSFWIINAVVSALALALLAYILMIRKGTEGTTIDLRFMPAINASFNGLAATFLIGGLLAIKAKRPVLHRALMTSAFGSSSLFLVGYLAYHTIHGDTIYHGPGRPFYLALLASHVLLSVPVVPMALAAFYFAFKKRFTAHTRVTRILFPIWLYVSITGVLVFFVLRGSAPIVP